MLISNSSSSLSVSTLQAKPESETASRKSLLKQGEQQVERHVAAHTAVSRQYASAPTYTYSQTVDGSRYIVSGDVSFDISAVQNKPEQTLSKAQLIQRAALAPVDPTPSDISASQRAQQLANQARLEIGQLAEENTRTSIDIYV